VQEVIYHGIDVLEYPYLVDSVPDEYLFSIGRITRNKGQHSAIEAARQTGMRLVLAGNVQNKPEDRAYFEELKESIDFVVPPNEHPGGPGYYETVVQPVLESRKQIIYIGELNSAQKKVWFMHAKATLFPVEWGEPFGLVLVESMACGTPVIAFRRGSVPEIVSHGHTGFVVDTSQEMARAVQGLSIIDRRDCRAEAEERFSLTVMAENYVKKYQQLLERKVYA
ncbi:MAG: glycosyltransferase, partial [Leptospiraceae bacterium]|nr:glycosyltransferase [Leptospiraceae bacterium]